MPSLLQITCHSVGWMFTSISLLLTSIKSPTSRSTFTSSNRITGYLFYQLYFTFPNWNLQHWRKPETHPFSKEMRMLWNACTVRWQGRGRFHMSWGFGHLFQLLEIGELAKANLETQSSTKIQALSPPQLELCHFSKCSRASLKGKDMHRAIKGHI